MPPPIYLPLPEIKVMIFLKNIPNFDFSGIELG
jgi:hypothetical protein